MRPIPFYRVLMEQAGSSQAEVSVLITLFNYEHFIMQALESVFKQDLDLIDLIIVDDRSQDNGKETVRSWLCQERSRFNNVKFVGHIVNSGLSASRNTGFSLCQTEFVFVLDADNMIYPRCLSRMLMGIRETRAAAAYCVIEKFGESKGLANNDLWAPDLFIRGNYIDAMAMIRKAAWSDVGGYSSMYYGWEDYDFWCKFVEKDFYAILVPEILARYRTHTTSMLQTTTARHSYEICTDLTHRHPWLKLGS
jgi:glycosyltransferase involved in cell wall biosynthesis